MEDGNAWHDHAIFLKSYWFIDLSILAFLCIRLAKYVPSALLDKRLVCTYCEKSAKAVLRFARDLQLKSDTTWKKYSDTELVPETFTKWKIFKEEFQFKKQFQFSRACPVTFKKQNELICKLCKVCNFFWAKWWTGTCTCRVSKQFIRPKLNCV